MSSAAKIATESVGWFRTVIDVGDLFCRIGLSIPKVVMKLLEWAAVALGSVERVLRSVAVSPVFVVANGGSVIAVLTSDVILTVWPASRNHIRGRWSRVRFLTLSYSTVQLGEPGQAIIVAHVLRQAPEVTQFASPLAHTLELHTTSIACNGDTERKGSSRGQMNHHRHEVGVREDDPAAVLCSAP
ncbi:hypothetical protein BDM02DRAFT_3128541 [Thelephora ganbajun]|uniref:Uncharacterized protein n=1 Tax=Thelephora ganbajun TaxID=370292 RepID=A0ACB6ZHE8_THEGA|nr:hypothetical protein BDM02DRAFT_3128541 [Thelephora ganbajun]